MPAVICGVFCDADSCAADVDQLCVECDRCFNDGLTAFESISDVVNMALLHSNRGKLMRLHAQSIASRLVNTKKREFTNAEKNFFLQVCLIVIVEPLLLLLPPPLLLLKVLFSLTGDFFSVTVS